jgi:hypothetical protein
VNREYYTRKKKEYDAQKKALLSLIKVTTGCESCGFNYHPQALTFDHIDPDTKAFNIANFGEHSWKDILEETQKCRVLCANCHNIHTAQQQDNGIDPTPITQKTANLINSLLPCALLTTNCIPAWTSFVPMTLKELPSTTLQCVLAT